MVLMIAFGSVLMPCFFRISGNWSIVIVYCAFSWSAIGGLILGVILALLQQHFGFIPLGANGGFIVDSYPVAVKVTDVIIVLITVILVTLLSMWPIRKIADRFVGQQKEREI